MHDLRQRQTCEVVEHLVRNIQRVWVGVRGGVHQRGDVVLDERELLDENVGDGRGDALALLGAGEGGLLSLLHLGDLQLCEHLVGVGVHLLFLGEDGLDLTMEFEQLQQVHRAHVQTGRQFLDGGFGGVGVGQLQRV